MTYKEKQELNELSKRCFGSSSKWKKFVDEGVPELFERDREVILPRSGGRMVKKTYKDHKYVVKHYDYEGIKKLMLEMLGGKVEQSSVPSVQVLDENG